MFNYIKDGCFSIFKNKLVKSTLFSLEDWLDRALTYFSVPHIDPCCTSSDVNQYAPTRYNSTNKIVEYYNASTKSWELTVPIPTNEDTVTILDSNHFSDFQKAHGSVRVGKSLFMGTRGFASNYSNYETRFVCYPDYDDLTKFTSVVIPDNPSTFTSIESMCYAASSNKVYAPIENSNRMVVCNASDSKDYQIVTLGFSPGVMFKGSTPIITDDTYLYMSTEELNGYFIKVRISDLVVIAEVARTPGVGTHTGTIDNTKTYGYFAGGATLPLYPKLFKLDLANMTFTYVEIPTASTITDDCCFIPIDAFSTGVAANYVVLGEETRQPSSNVTSIGGHIINVDDMTTVFEMDLMPSFGVFYDIDNYRLINLSLSGFIEVLRMQELELFLNGTPASTKFLTEVYTMRGHCPNELFITPDGYYVTNWFTLDLEGVEDITKGTLLKVQLNKVLNPVKTVIEQSFRLQ